MRKNRRKQYPHHQEFSAGNLFGIPAEWGDIVDRLNAPYLKSEKQMKEKQENHEILR